MRKDDVGVIYWQAPEIRKGEYDVMLVDIWSLGATVWELIEGTTPFEGQEVVGDRLPRLSGPVASSEALLDFLEMCSSPPHYRPPAQRLLEVCKLPNRHPLLSPITSTDDLCPECLLAIRNGALVESSPWPGTAARRLNIVRFARSFRVLILGPEIALGFGWMVNLVCLLA